MPKLGEMSSTKERVNGLKEGKRKSVGGGERGRKRMGGWRRKETEAFDETAYLLDSGLIEVKQ
jgi:hypothetical protein